MLYETNKRVRENGIYYHQKCFQHHDNEFDHPCSICAEHVDGTNGFFWLDGFYYHPNCWNSSRNTSSIDPSTATTKTFGFSAQSLRAEGNDLYRMVTKSNNSDHSWKISKLTEAIQKFEEGKSIASKSGDKIEWLKCARSIGVAYSYSASSKDFQVEKGVDWTINSFIGALTAFSEIITDHENIENKEWQNGVFSKLSSTITAAIEYCISNNENGWSKRCFLLERLLLVEEVSGDSACYTRVHVHVSIAEEIVKAIVMAEEAGEWDTVLTLVGELDRPLLLAREELSRCLSFFSFLPPNDMEFRKLMDRISKVASAQQAAKRNAKSHSIGPKEAKSLRPKGKELYNMATNSSSSKGKHHSWKISTLTEAIQNFAEGKQIASRAGDKIEWLYCARSIGAAYSFLAKEKEFQDAKGVDWTVNNFISALTAFSEIITDHRNIEDKRWQERVFNQLSSTITAAIEYC